MKKNKTQKIQRQQVNVHREFSIDCNVTEKKAVVRLSKEILEPEWETSEMEITLLGNEIRWLGHKLIDAADIVETGIVSIGQE